MTQSFLDKVPAIIGAPVSDSEKVMIEQLIDRCSLQEVILAIANICLEKKNSSCRKSWHDIMTAREWNKADNALRKAAQANGIRNL